MSWKAEVIADSSGKWTSNALRFATEEEALRYAKLLADRWTLVTDYRAASSEDEPYDRLTSDGTVTRIAHAKWNAFIQGIDAPKEEDPA